MAVIEDDRRVGIKPTRGPVDLRRMAGVPWGPCPFRKLPVPGSKVFPFQASRRTTRAVIGASGEFGAKLTIPSPPPAGILSDGDRRNASSSCGRGVRSNRLTVTDALVVASDLPANVPARPQVWGAGKWCPLRERGWVGQKVRVHPSRLASSAV
jgi:hypothetical protein